jgi:DNA-binding transcriptional regulator YiaG
MSDQPMPDWLSPNDVAADVAEAVRERVDRLMLPPPPERRRLREDASFSKQELAAILAVTPQTFAKWESGRYSPSGASRVAYAAVLGRLAYHELGTR